MHPCRILWSQVRWSARCTEPAHFALLGVLPAGARRLIAGSIVSITKVRMTKEQRRRQRERQQQERIDAWIKRVVAEAPPLTQEQRSKLAVLLEPVCIKPSDSR